MYSKWRGICGILSLTASLAMFGCGSTTSSKVRAVNASQGSASSFTIQVGQIPIVGALPFGLEGVQQPGQYTVLDTSGNYRPIEAGVKQTLSLYQQPNSVRRVQTTQTFAKGSSYTIVAYSQFSSVELLTLVDGAAAPSGGYGLRVMDTSTAAGAVDIYITAVGALPAGAPVVGNIQFGQVVNYLPLAPGTLEVQVTPVGNPSIVLASKAFSPAAGSNYSLFFLDPPIAGGTNYGVLTVPDPITK